VLAERYGASVPPVAVAHSLRVSVVIIVVPFALTYGGVPMEIAAYRPQLALDVPVLIAWIGAGFVVGEVSERLRMHNGYMLMPIFLGAGLTVAGVELSAVPSWLIDFAQLMFGLVLGSRYERAFFARHRMFIPFALFNSVFILVASALVGLGIAWGFDLPIASMIIATAPGGMGEMTIVAQALQIGVPLVVAFHLFRVVVVNMATQHIYTLAMWARGRLKKGGSSA